MVTPADAANDGVMEGGVEVKREGGLLMVPISEPPTEPEPEEAVTIQRRFPRLERRIFHGERGRIEHAVVLHDNAQGRIHGAPSLEHFDWWSLGTGQPKLPVLPDSSPHPANAQDPWSEPWILW